MVSCGTRHNFLERGLGSWGCIAGRLRSPISAGASIVLIQMHDSCGVKTKRHILSRRSHLASRRIGMTKEPMPPKRICIFATFIGCSRQCQCQPFHKERRCIYTHKRPVRELNETQHVTRDFARVTQSDWKDAIAMNNTPHERNQVSLGAAGILATESRNCWNLRTRIEGDKEDQKRQRPSRRSEEWSRKEF